MSPVDKKTTWQWVSEQFDSQLMHQNTEHTALSKLQYTISQEIYKRVVSIGCGRRQQSLRCRRVDDAWRRRGFASPTPTPVKVQDEFNRGNSTLGCCCYTMDVYRVEHDGKRGHHRHHRSNRIRGSLFSFLADRTKDSTNTMMPLSSKKLLWQVWLARKMQRDNERRSRQGDQQLLGQVFAILSHGRGDTYRGSRCLAELNQLGRRQSRVLRG
ncbi:hypothetical protein KQX54_021441 [Cotesia glomerata]|uniref:Uncharacterized protein n=1 Tax=Cotesia glomerata TaxID=32391 RepID=A0AAV7J8R5_COTGL|nr:hypothetical protein KQX54_021441 [Cotesia glomerata]